jgi:hypothetical protein
MTCSTLVRNSKAQHDCSHSSNWSNWQATISSGRRIMCLQTVSDSLAVRN